METKTQNNLQWKVNTPQLLREILSNDQMVCLSSPLSILSNILAELGERCADINDDKLNALMCRLAIYDISDPYSDNFNEELTQKTIEKGKK
jgi:hypothetical protein